ncbi:hypothetical protein MASR1M32_39610 [Rhodobacter sp.]
MPRRPEAAVDAVTEIEAEGEAEGEAADAPRRASMQPTAPLGAKVDFKTKDTTHGKTGAPLFVATPAARVERADYDNMLAVAKSHGGYYSSFRGAGAVPGFQFKTEAARKAFLEDMTKPVTGLEEAGMFGFDEEGSEFAAEFMTELAQVDDLFQNPRSDATTLEGAFADIDQSVTYVGDVAQDENSTFAERAEKAGADALHFLRTAQGKHFFVFENGDSVWIDVSHLAQGDGGSRIYAAVADYALNSGKTFIGDPDGLSVEALRRRTDAMLSSALKHGTTRHLAPHEDQIAGNEKLGVPPLRWTEGDDAGNLAALIEVSVSSLISHIPEVADARYDFQSRTFRSGEGQLLTDGDLDQWASAAAGNRAARVGRKTLRRGILLNTLARTESGARPGLLERALRQQRQLVARTPLGRSFYQQPAGDVGRANAADGIDERRQMIMGAATAAAEIKRLMPALRAELDRLDLKRVKLSMDRRAWWQGKFEVTGAGAMEITIGASLDPLKTLHHEVIHALRALNLFTPEEWRALEIAALKSWMEKHDIANRYPDLPLEHQIEEAIAEEFSQALEQKRSPKGSLLVTAFNKIARFLRAVRNVFNGAGFQTAEDVFGRVLAGEIGKRQQPGFHAAQDRFQRPRLARAATRQGRANGATAMQGAVFLPDRRIWEELRRAGVPIWQRLRNGRAAARDAVDRSRVLIQDRMLPILRAQRVIEESIGARLPDEMNAYAAETTYSGKVGRHLFEIDGDYTKPIIDLIAETKGRCRPTMSEHGSMPATRSSGTPASPRSTSICPTAARG